MRKKLFYVLLLILLAGIGSYVYMYKKIERPAFAGLKLGTSFEEFKRQQKNNQELQRSDDRVLYYTFHALVGFENKHFFGVPHAFMNQDSIVVKIEVVVTQRYYQLQEALEAAKNPNILSMNLTTADMDDPFPDPTDMSAYLQEYYQKRGYSFQSLQIPIHLGSNTFTEYRKTASKEGVNITLSLVYNDSSSSIPGFKGAMCHLALTFEYTDEFKEKHGLYKEHSDTPF